MYPYLLVAHHAQASFSNDARYSLLCLDGSRAVMTGLGLSKGFCDLLVNAAVSLSVGSLIWRCEHCLGRGVRITDGSLHKAHSGSNHQN